MRCSLPLVSPFSLLSHLLFPLTSPIHTIVVAAFPTAPLCSFVKLAGRGLSKLLLDEEGAEVGELPRAGYTQDGELDERPADDAGVGGFGLIAEFGFTLLYTR